MYVWQVGGNLRMRSAISALRRSSTSMRAFMAGWVHR
jgi:hypothetical protein